MTPKTALPRAREAEFDAIDLQALERTLRELERTDPEIGAAVKRLEDALYGNCLVRGCDRVSLRNDGRCVKHRERPS